MSGFRLCAPLRAPLIAGSVAASGDVESSLFQAVRFPSNDGNGTPPGDHALAVFRFSNPHSNGLPFRGPGEAGATYIFWVKTRQQTGYYVNFWWGPGDGSFHFDEDDAPYVGGHLYPTAGNNNGTAHEYEIASEAGDFRTTRGGGPQAAEHGVWRKQGIRVTVNGDDTVTIRYYLNLPSLDDDDIIEYTTSAGYGATQNAGVPSIFIIGDSPWYLNYQHECQSGSLRAFKVIAEDVGVTDMLAEAAEMSQMATAAGEAAVWWMTPGFSAVGNQTCPYTGRVLTLDDDDDQLILEAV